MTKAELIERYGIEYYEQRKIRNNANCKERYRNDPEFRETRKARQKERYKNDPEFHKAHNMRTTVYMKNDLNSNGKTKDSIRHQSSKILFKHRHHSRLKGYEIHHCFGYDDPSKFIYVPRELHRAIHALLRDNNIDADSNHFSSIAQLINECTEYMYISA